MCKCSLNYAQIVFSNTIIGHLPCCNHMRKRLLPFDTAIPEIFDPKKKDSNFLEANFRYFRLSTARDDKNNENCPSSFLVFGLKSC